MAGGILFYHLRGLRPRELGRTPTGARAIDRIALKRLLDTDL
jgi:hypothetical protein